MKYSIYKTAGEFLNVCRPVLEANEALYNLMLGIAIRLTNNLNYYGDKPLLATISDGEELTLAALMTPPHKLQLALFNQDVDGAIELLATTLHEQNWSAPGVIGEKRAVDRFASHWTKLTRTTSRTGMNQRIYELRKVNSIKMPNGNFRQATIDDLDLALKWGYQFYIDCFGTADQPESSGERTREMIEKGNLYFWCNPEPVSMAGLSRPTPHGISINYVYTPKEERRKGYASAVVAKLSQRCLDSGKEFCTLYTDLSNPTSNSVYQQVGFNPIADVVDIHFDPA